MPKKPNRAAEIVSLIYDMLYQPKFPDIPDWAMEIDNFSKMAEYIKMIRSVSYGFAHGDLTLDVEGRGFMAGCFKELQSNLRHLTWFAKRVASGDYEQQITYMGNFSEYFNRMARNFYDALKALRESETKLLQLTRELHKSDERWQLAISCTQDGVWDIDLVTRKAFLSPRLWEILRMPINHEDIDFDPVVWGGFIHSDDLLKWATLVNSVGMKMMADMGKQYAEFRVMGGDGKYRWLSIHHMIIMNSEGIPSRFVGTCADIQEMREREDKIRKQATLDQLTNLPNRYLYNDRLLQKMVMSRRDGSSIILALWDLDGFKWVNDTFGHLAGDRLLMAVADLMRQSLRESDTLARFGGDEFVMLLSSPRGQEDNVVHHITSRIFNSLSEPVDIDVERVKIGASCGVSFFPLHTEDGETLFNMADKALYHAKKTGKNKAVVWDPHKFAQKYKA